jgi:hypothetical protein
MWDFPSAGLRGKGKLYKKPDYGSFLVNIYKRGQNRALIYVECETMDIAHNCEPILWCEGRGLNLKWGMMRKAWYRQLEVETALAFEFKLRWM